MTRTKPRVDGTPGRLRDLFRPTFTDLVGLFLIVLVMLLGGQRMFGDADAATHVATGLWILDHRAVPTTDPFSSTFAGREWFAHEWLTDIGMAIAYRATGWAGVLLASALLIALSHLLLYRFLVRRGSDALVSFGAVVAAAAAACSHWLARPHLMTVLFLVIQTVILEEVLSGARRRAWLAALPPLVIVWANMHGGFLVAYVVLACYGAGALLVARPLLGPLLAASAGMATAALVNPWGWRLPVHLVTFFSARSPVLLSTDEFAAAALDDRAGAGLAIFLLLCLAGAGCGVGAWLAWRRPQRPGRGGAPASPGTPRFPLHPGTILALAVSAAMAFRSIRHVEVMAVFGAIVLADGVTAFLRARLDPGTCAELEAIRLREVRAGGGALAAAVALLILYVGAGGMAGAGFDPAKFPVAMVRELGKEEVVPAGSVLTPDIWGGYLILEWPRARVYVDGRWDMRGNDFWQRYATIYLARPGWDRLLREDGVSLALLPLDAPLARAMPDSPDWLRWRSDATSVVFRRR